MGFDGYFDVRQKLGSLASKRLVTRQIRSSNEEIMIFPKWQQLNQNELSSQNVERVVSSTTMIGRSPSKQQQSVQQQNASTGIQT